MKHNYHYLFSFLGSFFLTCTLAVAQAPDFLEGQEAEAYNAHKTEVKMFAKIGTSDEMGKMSIKYELNSTEFSALNTFVEQMETRKATYNYIYPDNDTMRIKAKQMVANQYEPDLIKYLFKAGKTVGSYNCRLMMRNKDTLSLTTTQQDTILAWAIHVNGLLKENPSLELRPLEFPIFKRTLTEQQLDLFLSIKLTEEVNGQVQKTWKTLKEKGLEYGLDSAVVSGGLFRYHMTRDKIIYVNYNNYTLREAALKNINQNAPIAIKRLENIPEATAAKNAYNGTLTW